MATKYYDLSKGTIDFSDATLRDHYATPDKRSDNEGFVRFGHRLGENEIRFQWKKEGRYLAVEVPDRFSDLDLQPYFEISSFTPNRPVTVTFLKIVDPNGSL